MVLLGEVFVEVVLLLATMVAVSLTMIALFYAVFYQNWIKISFLYLVGFSLLAAIGFANAVFFPGTYGVLYFVMTVVNLVFIIVWYRILRTELQQRKMSKDPPGNP